MVETVDLAQLRQLNLELLRQLWVGQDAMRRSVAKAAAESSLDSSSIYDLEMPSSQEKSSMAPRASHLQDANQRDPGDTSCTGGVSPGVLVLPFAMRQYQESLSPLRPCLAPSVATSNMNDPECSAEMEAQAPRSILDQESKLLKPRVTFNQESPVPEKSWRLRPYLGYDWIAGAAHPMHTPCLGVGGGGPSLPTHLSEPPPSAAAACLIGLPSLVSSFRTVSPLSAPSTASTETVLRSLDNSSPISSKPEDFFSKLQEFREANKEECIHRDPEPQLLGRRESAGAEEYHECVYCYRVNRRLFLVPSDPGTPCRLCRTPRDQRGPETLEEPAQVRVSVPLSVLAPPHQYRIHRRKSFDTSDTLALPRHCLLGWDILPPKSEKSSAPKSLDLWSCVASEAQHWKLSAGPAHLV